MNAERALNRTTSVALLLVVMSVHRAIADHHGGHSGRALAFIGLTGAAAAAAWLSAEPEPPITPSWLLPPLRLRRRAYVSVDASPGSHPPAVASDGEAAGIVILVAPAHTRAAASHA
jgi:hypothetical protein